MHKLLNSIILVLAMILALPCYAQVEITKTDKIQPDQQVFMDMAVSAAKTSVADQGLPCGAVVILNGAWRSTGMPSGEQSAEETAIRKSRTKSLSNAQLYTVVQPTATVMKAIADAGIPTVYYSVAAAEAIAAGIHSAKDYEGAAESINLVQVPLDEALSLVRSWKGSK